MRCQPPFSSCSLRGSKWPERTQLATCLPPGRGSMQRLVSGGLGDQLGHAEQQGNTESGICPKTDLLNWVWLLQLKGNNAFWIVPVKGLQPGQLQCTPMCCQLARVSQWQTHRERGIASGLWISSGYWVLDRTPWDRGINNGRINGQGTMRMSAPQGACVAFEPASTANTMALSQSALTRLGLFVCVFTCLFWMRKSLYCVYNCYVWVISRLPWHIEVIFWIIQILLHSIWSNVVKYEWSHWFPCYNKNAI